MPSQVDCLNFHEYNMTYIVKFGCISKLYYHNKYLISFMFVAFEKGKWLFTWKHLEAKIPCWETESFSRLI